MRHVRFIALCALCLPMALMSPPCKAQAQQTAQVDMIEYKSQEIIDTSAEIFLARMQTPEPGYHRFAAMHALAKKAKDSDIPTRWAILTKVVNAMNDKTRTENQRFQCCYVISSCGDDRWVQNLVYVLSNDPSETMRSVAAEALGDFPKCAAAQDALRQAAQREKSATVLEVINRRLNQGNAEYTPEQIKNTSAEIFLAFLKKEEVGYGKFAAMHALTNKAKESDAATRKSILTIVSAAMLDKSSPEYQRWQCCYVISDCQDELWVSNLVDVLTNDPSPIVRSVAATALGRFTNSAAAHDALVKAGSKETSERVLDEINRILGSTTAGNVK